MRACVVALAVVAVVISASNASAWEQDPFAPYIERSDAILPSAGNARDINAATQIIDPWPRYVGNKRIPVDGKRMYQAVERYRNNQEAPPPIQQAPTSSSGFTSR
jgi:hypothetical protein